MLKRFISRGILTRLDWLIIASSLLLIVFGLIIIYSLEINTGNGLGLFYKQLVFFLIGVVLFVIMTSVNYIHLSSYHWYVYAIGILLLVAVMLFGVEIRGVRGWFVVGPVSFQPVEFVKIFIIIFFAKFYSLYGPFMAQWRYVAMSILLIVPYLVLLVIQPDLGSGFIVAVIWMVMLFFTKIRGRQLAILAGLALLIMSLGWQVMAPYQKARLTTFLDPDKDPLGQGYNIKQALTAIGSGELLGRGLGLGPQSQLRFLPENRTDFIFSVIAEELGFVGATILLLLFALLLYRIIITAKCTHEPFGFYVVIGVSAFLAIQTYMNIAMNLSLFPVTGIPLPLVSQGGSSLWSILIVLGIVQSVVLNKKRTS